MKKRYFFLAAIFIGCLAHAQTISIPDPIFKAKLLSADTNVDIARNNFGSYIKIDTNNDGEIQLSEALQVFRLTATYGTISDMTGIQSFTNLRQLYCENNQLGSLNVTPLINLELLHCQRNQLISGTLDVS